MKIIAFYFLFFLLNTTIGAQDISLGSPLFEPQEEHTHGSTIVELPNGDLLAAWFQGHGERWADDVRIMGARKRKGNTDWSRPFVMADVPGFPDVNPVLFLDTRQQLWLVWYTVIANQWETSLIKYRTSTDYMQEDGAPHWDWQNVLHVKPGGPTERGIQPDDSFITSVKQQQDTMSRRLMRLGLNIQQLEEWIHFKNDILDKASGANMMRRGKLENPDGSTTAATLGYPYFRRMGWQTKNKAISIGNRIILPLYSDGLEMSLFAITDDYGAHWQFSTPLVGIANIQATILQKQNGNLVTYMRDNGPPPQRHPMSTSTDNGLSWSPVVDSQLPNPGSGSDAVTLANGHWVIAYNDTDDGRHSLAVSLSTDEGKTWPYKRHIEYNHERKSSAAYPSVIQGKDGDIHIVFSFRSAESSLETIKYISIDEQWIRRGDIK